jgi:hypothetical protein
MIFEEPPKIRTGNAVNFIALLTSKKFNNEQNLLKNSVWSYSFWSTLIEQSKFTSIFSSELWQLKYQAGILI